MYTLPFIFLLNTLVAQGIGFLGALAVGAIFPNILIGTITAALCAYGYARFRDSPPSWKVINLLLPPAIVLSQSYEIPPWIYLIGFLLYAGLHLPALWSRVPYYPTPHDCFKKIAEELPREKHFSFIDIGCGMGDLLVSLSTQFPNGDFLGVEIGLFPYLTSKIKTAFLRNVKVRFKSFWSLDLGAYDFIYAFLSPAPMSKLWAKFEGEAKSGTVLISNSFAAPVPTEQISKSGDYRGGTLYIYRHR